METYPYVFEPIYKERIWGGRNLERLFGRKLPRGKPIGESWDLTDLEAGTSVLTNGPEAGKTITGLLAELGQKLLGPAARPGDGRFPLLLKLLDANDILSVQVHPDAEAAARIGGACALKSECWYVLESREGFIYKGLREGVTPEQFRRALEENKLAQLLRRYDVKAGDFHYIPAGTVHALGAGVVCAEIQTPSDTTYRVNDWGRGREIHVDLSMQCIHFDSRDDQSHAKGNVLLVTDYFAVARRTAGNGEPKPLPHGRCAAVMIIAATGHAEIRHDGPVSPVNLLLGDTVLLPAGLKNPTIFSPGRLDYLEITLPET